MKSGRALALVCMAASLILAACGNREAVTPSPSTTNLLPTWTSSSVPTSPSTPTKTTVPTATPTATSVPCVLSAADYCIEDAFFVFERPIAPPGNDIIDRGYPYGSTERGQLEPHHGVEFNNASGTPVLAALGGTVFYSGDDTTRKFSPWSRFYGNIIVLEHPLSDAPFEKLYTLYAHLSKIDVSIGQVVTTGEKIGEVGLTGTAFGSHLHFEVRIDPEDYGSTLNPELWLIPHPGNGTLALSAIDKSGANIFPQFNVQYFPDRDQPATRVFDVDGYAKETVNLRDPWNEVAAVGDQPAGWYRVAFLWAGSLNEKWVEIQPGKLTFVNFMVK
ncbi:MAG TPA: M23 family metallopeptidase [Anaerolineales bacterium]